MKPFKNFQIRWAEKLHRGKNNTHYLTRWSLFLFGYSMRIHHWIHDDVHPHYHDHAANFISFLVWGSYTNHTPEGSFFKGAPAINYAKAEGKHWLELNSRSAWTITFWGRPYRKWGFWVDNHLWRPLRYFSKYGKQNSQ